MSTRWAVTAVEHPALRGVRGDCTECLAQAEHAAVMARLTGSKGATYSIGTHSATVARLIAVVDLLAEAAVSL